MPRPGDSDGSRNAMITMTYFRPWVLDESMASEHVPHASHLRIDGKSWTDSLRCWFELGLLTEESKRYVTNFLFVTSSRPPDDDDLSQHSEDLVDDEELVLSSNDLREALVTHIGGARGKAQKGEEEGQKSHYENSKSAIELMNKIWGSQPSKHNRERAAHVPHNDLDEVLKAARASQRNDDERPQRGKRCKESAMVEELPAGTPRDVDAWLADIETSASVDQFDVLKLVARRVKAEMAEGDRAPPLSQPLIWLVHGRPGVGKTDGVLKPIKALFERCGYKQGWKLRHLLNVILT